MAAMLTRSPMQLSFAALPALAVLGALASCSNFEPAPPPKDRKILMEMRATLRELPEGAERATIWLPTPLGTEDQRRGPLRLTALGGDARQRFDTLGNDIVSVTGTPSKAQPLEIYYQVELTRYERRAPSKLYSAGALPSNSPWLVPARDSDVPGLARKTLELVGRYGTIDGRVLRLYDHTIDELTLSAPPPNRLSDSRYGEGHLPWILEEKVGDSIDYATFFVAHCQAAKIPSSFELGYRLPEQERMEAYRPRTLHAWARLELPDRGWVPFDPAMADENPGMRKAYFGGLDSDRILMSRGRDLQLNPPLQGEPLNYFGWPVARAGKIDLTDKLEVEIRLQDQGPQRDIIAPQDR
jgi:transglutaminase-like putative cysteine protease